MSVEVRKPEILFFADTKNDRSHVILLQGEVSVESSRRSGQSTLVIALTNVCAKSKSQDLYIRQSPQWVLRPCDLEICRKENDSEIEINVSLNPIDVHLSVSTLYTIYQVQNCI